MAVETGETVGTWLGRVLANDASTEQDSARMQNLLRRVGFSRAVVVLGVVYVEGRGTADFPPMSLRDIAKVLIQRAGCGG